MAFFETGLLITALVFILFLREVFLGEFDKKRPVSYMFYLMVFQFFILSVFMGISNSVHIYTHGPTYLGILSVPTWVAFLGGYIAIIILSLLLTGIIFAMGFFLCLFGLLPAHELISKPSKVKP